MSDTNNPITILKGADRVRKRPAVIFGAEGNEGVACCVRSLTDIFVTEVIAGYAESIDIKLYPDHSIELTCYGSGIVLDEDSWQDTFCELCPAPAYAIHNKVEDLKREHNSIFGRDGSDLGNVIPSGGQFELCCVQYVSERMLVESVRNTTLRSVSFAKGQPVTGLYNTVVNTSPYTRILFKADPEVFGSYGSMRDVCYEILKSGAISSPNFRARLYDEESGKCDEFHMPKGAASAVKGPVFTKTLTALGKDRDNLPEYKATVKVTVGFDSSNRAIECYHNRKHIEYGGTPLEAALERIETLMGYACCSELSNIDMDVEYLSSRIYLVIETCCDPIRTAWVNGARNSIRNRMITDMVHDVLDNDFVTFVTGHSEEIAKQLID